MPGYEKTPYHKYIKAVRQEVRRLSCWPSVGNDERRWEADGLCPFDLMPGYIANYLGDDPLWSKTFEEKVITSNNDKLVKIELDPMQYWNMQVFSEVSHIKDFPYWFTDLYFRRFFC